MRVSSQRLNPPEGAAAVPVIRNSIVIDRPVDVVFDSMAADEQGFISQGPSGIVVGGQAGAGPSTAGWTKRDRPRLLESDTKNSQFRLRFRVELEPVEQSTLVTTFTDLRLTGAIGCIAGLSMRLARKSATREFQVGLQELKESIEAQT
jgi:hypothetical protein